MSRSDRKRKTILEAATRVFLEKGYDGTSMDDVAACAVVSKPTVYKYFQDKSQLYSAIVLSTVEQVDEVVRIVADSMANAANEEKALTVLARKLLTTLTQPDLLKLRRMIIANADRFPDIARAWYEQGFGRVLATLARLFSDLAARGLIRKHDSEVAASHFVGLLLWIPLNQAMFGGDGVLGEAEISHLAKSSVRAFLEGYRTKA